MTNAPLNGSNLRGAIDLSSLVRPAAPPPVTGAPAASVPSLVIAGTDANFSTVLELSNTVPVIVEFYAQGIQPALASLVQQYGGRLVLATVDGSTNPQLAQSFQVQEVPAVAAVVGGRPLQLFVGMPSEADVRTVFDQVLEVASQNGITGTVTVTGEPDAPPTPAEQPLPPHHQEAYDAIAAGDFTAAIGEYRAALTENPRDQLAVAGLAQVGLLQRIEGTDVEAIRAAGQARASDLAAQLAVADIDVASGAFDEAFARLLDLFPSLDQPDRDTVRTRLLDYFEIIGPEDPAVIAARRRLTGLLY